MRRRLLQGTIVAIATVIMLLRGGHVPSRDFWRDKEAVVVVAALTLGSSAFAQAVGSYRRERGLAFELEVQDVLKATQIRLVETAALDWKDVGLHAFMVRRKWPRPWQPVLVRAGRWRLHSTPPVTGVRWTKGKGVIGLCWARMQDVGVDLTKDWGDPAQEMSEDEWHALPAERRYGLTYPEYQRVHNYGAIVASPLIVDDVFKGCVSVDAPGEGFDALWSDSARSILQDAALQIHRSATPLSHR